MTDLLVLVADSQMRNVVSAVLSRPLALGIVEPSHRFIVHPGKDPGTAREGVDLLADSITNECDALIPMDWDGSGIIKGSAAELQDTLEAALLRRLPKVRSCAIVIDPELDSWMWATDEKMRAAIGWVAPEPIRAWAARELGATFDPAGKPSSGGAALGPKELLEAVLKEAQVARSGSLYAEIARTTSLTNCIDPAFVRLRQTLRSWYEAPEGWGAYS